MAGRSSTASFFSVDSDCKVDYRLDSAAQIARVLQLQWSLGLKGGVLVANPVPASFALPRERIDAAIDQALREAAEQGIGGKQSTPFLLARVAALTGGDSLTTNIALVLNNARLASAIAAQYQLLGGYDSGIAAPPGW